MRADKQSSVMGYVHAFVCMQVVFQGMSELEELEDDRWVGGTAGLL